MTTTTVPFTGYSRDRLRQALNLILAIAQLVVVIIGALNGSNINIEDPTLGDPPIVPASYAFAIWGLIYPAAIAYAVYQFLPRQRENPLLRQIGWYTIPAYVAMTLWVVTAQQQLIWTTWVCMVAMLVSLIGAFVQLVRYSGRISRTERALVVVPISVHAGWITVATVANTATALYNSGVSNLLLPDPVWAALMAVAAGLIGAAMTWFSRGNLGYGLTIVWALVGIAAANVGVAGGLPVVVAAGAMVPVVAGTLVWAQLASRKGRP
ncbi:MAG TPA: hypothetical protein VFS21_28505 [Roseiflexaceae bacterium]|nr:hypothetical protein [Roseiflexaceae bacterium]